MLGPEHLPVAAEGRLREPTGFRILTAEVERLGHRRLGMDRLDAAGPHGLPPALQDLLPHSQVVAHPGLVLEARCKLLHRPEGVRVIEAQVAAPRLGDVVHEEGPAEMVVIGEQLPRELLPAEKGLRVRAGREMAQSFELPAPAACVRP